jgi:hypothetical protein
MGGYTLEGSLGLRPVTECKIYTEYTVDADQATEINKFEPVYMLATGEIAAWTPSTGILPIGVAIEKASATPGSGVKIVVCEDPAQIYEIASDAAWDSEAALLAASDNEWFTMVMSDNSNGQSTAKLDTDGTDDGADAQYILKIIGKSTKVGNVAATTAGCFVKVRIHTLFQHRALAAPDPST